MGKTSASTICAVIIICLSLTSVASEASLAEGVNSGWGTAALVEIDNAGHATYPQVAVDGSGNAIAVWHQHDGTRDNIMSNRYVVGTGWGTATLVETDDSGPARYPQVAVDGSGNAIAVWHQHDGTSYNIYSNRYEAGTGWGTATLIETDSSGTAQYPQVAVDNSGNAIVVWHQWDGTLNSIYSNRYVVGTGWGTATLIETGDLGHAQFPQVAIDGSGDATAVWDQHDGTFNSIYSNRYEVGTGWGTATLIETDDVGTAFSPKVAVGGSGDAIAVWWQFDGAVYNIYSNRYVVGTGWGTAILIETDNAGIARSPQVAIDGSGDAVAVWQQSDGATFSIWSNRYAVGTGWGTAELIEADDAASATDPQVAVDRSGSAIAVWIQSDSVRTNIWSNRYEVGTGWGTAELIETDNSGNAASPQVAVDSSGNAISVWHQWDGVRYNIWSNRYVKPDITPPPLSLDSPSDGLTTETPTVTTSGTTEPGVTLSINGITVAVESDGSFSCTIALVEGDNTITAIATDTSDNSATVSVSVTYVNPVPGIEEELNDALDELIAVQDELNTTQYDLDAVEAELDATKDELNATQNDLDATEEELSGAIGDLDDVKSQNLTLMAILVVFAILAVVMSVMFFSLRKRIADMSGKPVEEEIPPPPNS